MTAPAWTSTPASRSRRYHTADEFIAAHVHEWDELRAILGGLKGRRISRLDPGGVMRFAELHRMVSADLAVAQLRFPRSPIVVALNELVAQSHNALYAERRDFWGRLGSFFASGYPRVVRANSTIIWISVILFVGAIGAGVLWYELDANSALDAFGLVGGQFNEAEVPLTSVGEGIVAFVEIGLNNIRVAFLVFALGVLGCIGTGFILAFNGLLVGVFAAHAFALGRGADFMALVTPHGVLELTIIVLAGAAGVRIGWAVISPGRRRRTLAVADAGRDAVKILIGTMPAFVLAALVEGFVTTAGWPIAVNIAFGWALGIAYWIYLGFAGESRGDVREPA